MFNRVRIEPTPGTKAALDRLATLDVDKALRAELNAATQSLVTKLRAAILAKPSATGHKTRGRGRQGLRVSIARNIRKHVRLSKRHTQISITLESHGGLENLGRVVEGEKPWHHANSSYVQPPTPFWWDTIESEVADLDWKIQAAVDAAVERATLL